MSRNLRQSCSTVWREFLAEWVRAVNGHGGFGTWAADVSRNPVDIHEILASHNK